MEDALRVGLKMAGYYRHGEVLILVLMEDALREPLSKETMEWAKGMS